MILWIIFLLLGFCLVTLTRIKTTVHRRHGNRAIRAASKPSGFPQAKPDWVRDALLALHENSQYSHRKLADLFNRIYFAHTGISVGRTWVRETIKKHEHDRLHMQKELKHRIPRFRGTTPSGESIRLAFAMRKARCIWRSGSLTTAPANASGFTTSSASMAGRF